MFYFWFFFVIFDIVFDNMFEGLFWKLVVDICDGEIKCLLMLEDFFDEINVDWVMDDNLVLFVVFVVVEFWIFFMENDVFIEFKIFEKRVVVLIKFE